MTVREFLEYIPFIRIFAKEKRAIGAAQTPRRSKNMALAICVELLSIMLLYGLLSPAFAMPFYNKLILHPISEQDDLTDQILAISKYFHCTFQEARFPAPDGETIHGWYFNHTGCKKVILVSHGNGGSIEHRLALCPLLLQTGSSVFLYDYEGFGKSTGSPTLPRMCEDAVAAFDYLVVTMHVKHSNIVLYGESIGAGVTSELSTRRQSAGIILQSPFTSLPDAGADRILFFRLYPVWLYPAPLLSNIDIMSRPHAPLLLIHGKKDDLLSYHYSERIMAQAAPPKTLVLLPGAGHVDIYKTDVAVSLPALNKFLAQLPNK